jgi:hypothetical protein
LSPENDSDTGADAFSDTTDKSYLGEKRHFKFRREAMRRVLQNRIVISHPRRSKSEVSGIIAELNVTHKGNGRYLAN